MAITSINVNAGDDILAVHHNNLRADLLTGDVTIAGVKTFSGIPVFSAGITISDDSRIAVAKKLYFGVGNTYLIESPLNEFSIVANGTLAGTFASTYLALPTGINLILFPTQKQYWDNGVHTHTAESSDNVVDYTVGGAIKMRMDVNGIAPGDNESMMWDVVILSLDGTSGDTVAYVIDELKIYSLICAGHPTSTSVHTITDRSVAESIDAAFYGNDVLEIAYGASYGAGDAAQVIIFYIA